MKKVVNQFGETEIYVQNVRFTVKSHYHPPYLWIEQSQPRKGGYKIVLQLDATQELMEALDHVILAIRDTLREQEAKR